MFFGVNELAAFGALVDDEALRARLLALADRTVELASGDIGAYRQRGELLASWRRFTEARLDFQKSVLAGDAGKHAGWYERYELALCCLAERDRTAYQKVCAEIVNRFRDSHDENELNYTVWTCSLAPKAFEDYGPLVALARRDAEARPSAQLSHEALGAALFRAGQFEAALEALTKADSAAPTDGAYAWLFLAMTQRQLGQIDQAHAWYEKAATNVETAISSTGNEVGAPLTWNRRLTLALLLAEAAELLGIIEPPAPEP